MLITLFISQLISVGLVQAAPTHHDLAAGLVKIANANNEADGPFKHQVCFYDVSKPSGKVSENDKTLYRVLVVSQFSEGSPVFLGREYAVTVGPYWVAETVAYLGSERLQKFSCPGKPAIVYKEE